MNPMAYIYIVFVIIYAVTFFLMLIFGVFNSIKWYKLKKLIRLKYPKIVNKLPTISSWLGNTYHFGSVSLNMIKINLKVFSKRSYEKMFAEAYLSSEIIKPNDHNLLSNLNSFKLSLRILLILYNFYLISIVIAFFVGIVIGLGIILMAL